MHGAALAIDKGLALHPFNDFYEIKPEGKSHPNRKILINELISFRVVHLQIFLFTTSVSSQK